jgi:hypothetical protein
MSDTRSVYQQLLADKSGDIAKFDRAVSALKSQLNMIVSDPDFGDPVLGSSATRHKELTRAYQNLVSDKLYTYVINENNPGTYQPPALSRR